MITKNYTADRTETPGDATSTIPAAMANYWINGVNSLISDLTPLKDAGGFYAPVDFNVFTVTSDTAFSSVNQTIGITKVAGSLSISSNIITLTGGFYYLVNLSLAGSEGGVSGYFTAVLSNTSNVSYLSTINLVVPGYNNLATTSSGIGLINLSSLGDASAKVIFTGGVSGTKARSGYGQLEITKYKLIPFTSAT